MGKAKVSVVEDQHDQGSQGHVDAPEAAAAEDAQQRQRKAPVHTPDDGELRLLMRIQRLLAKSSPEQQRGAVRYLAGRYGVKVEAELAV